MNSFGKNLNIRKRSAPLEEKELFCELVDMYEELAIRSEKLYHEWSLNLQDYEEAFFLTIENLFYLKYGEWKTAIITWYVWERKDVETGEIGPLEFTNEDTGKTKEIIIKCADDLWSVLLEIEKDN